MVEEKRQLKDIQCFLMDMDGTIFLGNQLLPGAVEWLALLESNGIAYMFLTNNSSRSRVEYAQKLQKLGLPVREEKIFTSGEATAIYLKQNFPGASLKVFGTPPLVEEFERHGFVLTDDDHTSKSKPLLE